MSYAPKRKAISKAQRQAVYDRDGGICYLCSQPIAEGEPFDVDHELARELGGADDISNYRPAHKPCHRLKTKGDVKLIAKSNRIRRNANPETRRQTKHPIRSRKAQWPKRSFPKRQA